MAITSSNNDETVRQKLKHIWPGEDHQINLLSQVFAAQRRFAPNLVICGGSATGKTGIVRDLLREHGVRHAYVSCTETSKPRQLLSSCLSQLAGSKRQRGDGYASCDTADNIGDFLLRLTKLCPSENPTAFLVLDDAHHLAKSPLLGELLQARELSGANVSTVLLTRTHLHSASFAPKLVPVPPAIVVEMTPLKREQAVAVLIQDAPTDAEPELYRMYAELFVYDCFQHLTNSIADLRILARQLWPQYIAPLIEKQIPSNFSVKQQQMRLFTIAQRVLLPSVRKAFRPGMHGVDEAVLKAAKDAVPLATAAAALRVNGPQANAALTKLSLSRVSKLLLVSAYIASHNKVESDRALFEIGGRAKRLRSKGGQNADRQAEDAKEARLKGPHAFSVHRLLLIYAQLAQSLETSALPNVPRSVATQPGSTTAPAAGASGRTTGPLPAQPAVAAAGRNTGGAAAPLGSCQAGGAAAAGRGGGVAVQSMVPLGKASGTAEGSRSRQSSWLLSQPPNMLTLLCDLVSLKLLVQNDGDLLDSPRYTCAITEDMAMTLATDLGLSLAAYVRYS